MKIQPNSVRSGVLFDPETKQEFPFSEGQAIEVPDETAQRAINSGLWVKAENQEN